MFQFTHFDIEDGDDDCEYDWVQVIDGDGTELLPKSCGDQIPENFTSRTNTATVKFHSDVSETREGFRLEYSQIVGRLTLDIRLLKQAQMCSDPPKRLLSQTNHRPFTIFTFILSTLIL